MAALTTTNPTLLDWAKQLDPNGAPAQVIEILNQTNEIIQDATALEANGPISHRSTIRAGLPTPTWRRLYGFVAPTKSQYVQVTDNIGMLEDYSEVDKALADLNGNTAAFRLNEDRAHIEGMNQEFASTLFTGNETTEPEAFTGFNARFNSTSAENGGQILQAASTGGGTAYSSIWLVTWGPQTCHLIFPKGGKGGLQVNDKGQVTIESLGNSAASAGRMEAYRTHYRWDVGLCLRDWRYVVRIQVDTGELTKAASAGGDLIDLMAQAIELLPSTSVGRPVFYMNRTCKSFLRRQIANKVASSTLTMDQVAGKHVMTFDSIPVRRVDALGVAETVVS